jgi:hypothetical protein
MRCHLPGTSTSLAAVLILSLLPGGSVLCVGPYGHVALESRSAPCVLADPGTCDLVELATLSHAHGCVDIPLPTTWMVRGTPAAGVVALTCPAAPVPLVPAHGAAPLSSRTAQHPPPLDPRLARLRTTILLV